MKKFYMQPSVMAQNVTLKAICKNIKPVAFRTVATVNQKVIVNMSSCHLPKVNKIFVIFARAQAEANASLKGML